MPKITTFLWFDDQAEQAANFYTSIFKNSKIISVARFGDASPRPKGMVMTVTFEIDGQEFTALNGGPEFKFTPAVSFYIHCDTQQEVDYYWERLSEGGEKGQCGWLTDQFGVSWQIVPDILVELMGDPDPVKAARVTQAMLQMTKLDIAGLKRAYNQEMTHADE